MGVKMFNEIKINEAVLSDEEMKAINLISQSLMKFSIDGALSVACSVLGATLFTRIVCGCPNCPDDIQTEIIKIHLDEISSGILSNMQNALKVKKEKWLEDNLNHSATKH